MSNAIVKWRGPESEAGRKIDTALEKWGHTGGLQKLRRFEKVETSPLSRGQARGREAVYYAPSEAGGQVVDLPRICAVHDKLYAARYIRGADGRFRHAQSIKVTDALYLGQYADNPHRTLVPAGDLADETCPWCGASGFSSVRCGSCGKEICYGKTTGRFFRCRASCPGQGNMVSKDRGHEGVTPSSRRGGYEVS